MGMETAIDKTIILTDMSFWPTQTHPLLQAGCMS